MADLHHLSVQEAVNTDTSSVWDLITNVTDAEVSGGTIQNIDISGYHTLGLDPDGEIYFHFHNTSTATLVQADALKLAAGLSFIKIPRGMGSTIYFNYISTSASDAREVRIVKM
jgi:hypothetical protein|tara:strand:- start:678 stop:1019 length:342 start_codon:yes stop_codon:yes gene_type:complete